MKVLYLSLGSIALVCGIVGIVTPLVPTTPFILLSAFCFARGSKRFYAWLTTHRTFGVMILQYEKVGVPPNIKAIAFTLATVSIGISAYVTQLYIPFLCAWIAVSIVIIRLPYRKENKIPP